MWWTGTNQSRDVDSKQKIYFTAFVAQCSIGKATGFFFSCQEGIQKVSCRQVKLQYERLSDCCLLAREFKWLFFWKKKDLFYISTYIQIFVYSSFLIFFLKPDELYFEEGDIIYISDMVSLRHPIQTEYFWDTSEMQHIPSKIFSLFSEERYQLVERNLQRENWTNSKQLW